MSITLSSRFILLGGLAGLPVSAQIVPVLETVETFTYASGSIVGRSGGEGWSGAWFNPYSQQPLSVNASGQMVHTGTSTIQAAARVLDQRYSAATVGSVFISFEAWLGSQSGGGTPTLRLLDTTLPANNVTGGIGNNGSSTNYSILGENLAAGGDSGVHMNALRYVLFEVDYTAGQSRLWVGSTPWSLAARPAATPSVSMSFAPTFNRLDLYVRGLTSFDNLQVYSLALPSAVPEPAGAATVLAGAAALLTASRRRRSGRASL